MLKSTVVLQYNKLVFSLFSCVSRFYIFILCIHTLYKAPFYCCSLHWMYGGSLSWLPTLFCLFSIPLTFTEPADWKQSCEVAHWWICFVSTCNFVLLLSQFLKCTTCIGAVMKSSNLLCFMVGKNCKCRGAGETEGWAQARWIHFHSCVMATQGCSWMFVWVLFLFGGGDYFPGF